MANVLLASAKGASFLIFVQVFSRALTFVVNQVLLTFLSPELLGASAQLELYSISVLYFSRESLRVALQRQTDNSQAVVNLAYIAVLLGFPFAYIFAALYVQANLPQLPFIHESLKICATATLLELLAEPCFVIIQQKMMYNVRAGAETTATIVRCLVTFSAVIWSYNVGRDLGVLPFALGQLGYALSLLSIYCSQTWSVARRNSFSFIPRQITASQPSSFIALYFSRSLCTLGLNLYLQSAIKYILTQGDAIIMTSMATLHDQGAYALASNYGGLIARVLFQPIEDSCRNLFAKLCNTQLSDNNKPTADGITQAHLVLCDILKFYNILTLIFWAVGPSIAPLLLQLVAGRRWSQTGAGEVLATYCYYIPFLALNGITEAFIAAVATNEQLRRQSFFMGLYFIGFAIAAYVAVNVMGLGAQGLVWANCINMLLRIVWNRSFIKAFFARNGKHFSFQQTLPTRWSYSAATCAAIITMTPANSTRHIDPPFFELLVRVGAIAVVFGVILVIAERDYLLHCYQLLAGPQRLNIARKVA